MIFKVNEWLCKLFTKIKILSSNYYIDPWCNYINIVF